MPIQVGIRITGRLSECQAQSRLQKRLIALELCEVHARAALHTDSGSNTVTAYCSVNYVKAVLTLVQAHLEIGGIKAIPEIVPDTGVPLDIEDAVGRGI